MVMINFSLILWMRVKSLMCAFLGISFSRSQLSRDTVLIKEIPSCITTKEVKQREGIVILNILKVGP